MAMARRHLSRRAADKHDWLVLVPFGHQYEAFISDILGYDPEMHDGSVSGIVTTVMRWLATRPDAVRIPNPQQVISLLPEFDKEIGALRDTWRQSPPWADIVLAALQIAKRFAVDA